MTKAEFMALAGAKYDELNALKDSDSLLSYERDLAEIMRELSREIVETQLEGKSKDRRKKKRT